MGRTHSPLGSGQCACCSSNPEGPSDRDARAGTGRLRCRSRFLVYAPAGFLMAGITPFGLVAPNGLVAEAPRHDFGRLKPDQARRLVHEFLIMNKGARPLRIVAAKSSCSCTVSATPTEPIQPHQSVPIRIAASWPGRFGRQREQIVLRTDSLAQPFLILEITGDIVAEVVHWPEIISFGVVKRGEHRSRTLTLAAGAEQKPFRITSYAVDGDFIKLQPDRPVCGAPIDEVAFSVSLASGAPIGFHRGTLRFTVESPDPATIEVPFQYRVAPAVAVEPAEALFIASRADVLQDFHVTSESEITGAFISGSDSLAHDSFSVSLSKGSTRAEMWWSGLVQVRMNASVTRVLSRATLVVESADSVTEIPIWVLP